MRLPTAKSGALMVKQKFSGLMARFGRKLRTPRFLLLVGLIVAGQIIIGTLVYVGSGHSYARTGLLLTAFLLLCGIEVLASLQEPAPRKLVLEAGCFVVLALLFLIVSSGFASESAGSPLTNPLWQFLAYGVLVIALLAFLGKILDTIVPRPVPPAAQRYTVQPDQPVNWFARLSHLALAGIAGTELFLQISFGNRLLLLPFSTDLYYGVTLNSVAIVLLGAILLISLLRLNSPSTSFDGWMTLILSAICFLFQYTFGSGEFIRLHLALSLSAVVGVNLLLSIAPLVPGIFALFSEWGRHLTNLWLAIQLLIFQQLLQGPSVRTVGASQSDLYRQVILYALLIGLCILVLRLLFAGEHRQMNVIDAIAIVLIVLVVGLTAWSSGQDYYQQAQALLPAQQGVTLLSLSYSLVVIAYLMGICTVLTVGFLCAHELFLRRSRWSGRIEHLAGSLLVLSITIGVLILINAVANQSDYLTAAVLNTQALNIGLPAFSISNQYVLDGLFVLMLLLFIPRLATQHWNRTFAHTERALLILSGGACLLILISTGRRAVLPSAASSLQQIVTHNLQAFTAGRIVTTCILTAALISLCWLPRSRNRTERALTGTIFGVAAFFALIDDFFLLPVLLLIALILLVVGTLIVARIEHEQTTTGMQPTDHENSETASSPVS
jgi:hypothetical protein